MQKTTCKFEISVIIPTYNRSKLLELTLLSLQRQNIDKSRFEVIVADDGSSDDSKEVAGRYGKDMNVKYVYQDDMGYRPASARNKGIKAAEGHSCLFIDSGVLLKADCLQLHIDFYSTKGDNAAAVGYVFGFERTKDSERRLMEIVNPEYADEAIKKISMDEMFFDIREEQYSRYNDEIQHLPAPWYYFWTCHVSVPRSQLFAAGLFDESYDGRWGVEDNDLAFQLCLQGVKIYLLRSAEALHYPHHKDKEERRLEGFQNCKYFNDKFRTLETQLFHDCYMNQLEFVDINELSLKRNMANEKARGGVMEL